MPFGKLEALCWAEWPGVYQHQHPTPWDQTLTDPRQLDPLPGVFPGGCGCFQKEFSAQQEGVPQPLLGHSEIICRLKNVLVINTGYDFCLLSTLAFEQRVMYSPFQDSC